MTVRQVGGAIIDLTEREAPNDQLSAFYPGARRYKFQLSSSSLAAGQDEARGRSVELVVVSPTSGHQHNTPEVLITYSLRDGEPFVRVRASYRNPSNQAITVRLVDDLRADRTFEFTPDDTRKLYWVFDRWFGTGLRLLCGRSRHSKSQPRRAAAHALLSPGWRGYVQNRSRSRTHAPSPPVSQKESVGGQLPGASLRRRILSLRSR